KTKRPSNKLDYKKLKPFKIKEVIANVNYRLDLPKTIRIHPVFHLLLLELAADNTKLTKPIKVEPTEPEYKVEAILDSQKKGRVTQYLVK
ncbi:MAG: hypothetical protein JWP44_4978, partial [Mucilaginibacter sp.]|nr:hypothetical protein [Mucilaginibacter sp.]